MNINKLLILISYTKFELNSLRNIEITMITDISGCRNKVEAGNDVMFNPILHGGHDALPKMFFTTVLKRLGGES